jgi:adenine deaminase
METIQMICGNFVDVVEKRIFPAEIHISAGKILHVRKVSVCPNHYILPGLVDAHVHIESSMLVPQQFAKLAVKHGTVASVSDPHEIANVMGVEGLNFMLGDAKKSPFKFYFGVPSCVPATAFESSGSVINSAMVENLLSSHEFVYLSEMMNFPGVVFDDAEVLAKLAAAKKYNKPVDGHAPGLSGDNLRKYAAAGITTDHESTSSEEAIEKIKLGIKLQIREGSAAKNFDQLIGVISSYPNDVMLCTDDCHPDDLVEKHILNLIKRGIAKGFDIFDLWRAASYNPVMHYKISVGLLETGDPADFVLFDNLTDLNVLETYIDGKMVYNGRKPLIEVLESMPINTFVCDPLNPSDIQLPMVGKMAKAIVAIDGDLYTSSKLVEPLTEYGYIVSDPSRDILKIVVVNRYQKQKPVVGLIQNFGLKTGAIAGSIAHDSHNIICVGVSDSDILVAINAVIDMKGGIVAVNGPDVYGLALPVAGLMSAEDGHDVANKYQLINKKPREWGSSLHAPFMTLSFMALLVIPELKIGDKGLFDVKEFKITSLYV